MAKYKIGDILKVRSDHPRGSCKAIDCSYWNDDMDGYKGNKIIIEKITKEETLYPRYLAE